MEKVNILMVGGRRCGKTTILSKIACEFEKILSENGRFQLEKVATCVNSLNQAEQGIKQIFQNNTAFDKFPIDSNPTFDVSYYTLFFSPIRTENTPQPIQLDFYDVPGEYYNFNISFVEKLIETKKFDVIIIAIDTPSMMEENGFYVDDCNCTSNITDILKKCLNKTPADINAYRMILFVPVKCERYVIANNGDVNIEGINDVANQVKRCYKDLIEFIDVHQKQYITTAILPIITIKAVQWNYWKIKRNGQEEDVKNDKGGLKAAPIFSPFSPTVEILSDDSNHPQDPYAQIKDELRQFYQDNGLVSYYSFKRSLYNAAKSKLAQQLPPDSCFCDQPLIYTLVYLMKYLEHASSAPKGLINRLLHLLGILKNPTYQMEIKYFREKKMQIGNGFIILNDPLHIG